MSRIFDVEARSYFTITVNDEDVIDRWVENHPAPTPANPDARIRDVYYDMSTATEVAEHLAWNCALHGRSVASLDGFADLPDDAVTVRRNGYPEYEVDEVSERSGG